MKVVSKISPKKFQCPAGRVKVEGKKAETPFCYRLKVQLAPNRKKRRTTKIELYSRITGRKIGYIAARPSVMITPKESEANVWEELEPGYINTPESIDKKMKNFIVTAQDLHADPKLTEQYRKLTANAWRKILREARKK